MRAAVLTLALCVASTACVSHPVGPARTFAKYEGKAATTAESALSEVQTAKLAADTAQKGNAFGPYTSQVLGDAEESIAGLDGTFGSIQPPDEHADQLAKDLGTMLGDAEDHVTDLRVAVRRGELRDLEDLIAPLEDDIDALEGFLEEHQS